MQSQLEIQNGQYQINILISEVTNLPDLKPKILDPYILVGAFKEKRKLEFVELEGNKAQFKKSLNFVQNIESIQTLEQNKVEIYLMNKMDESMIGYIKLDLLNIYLQEKSCLMNRSLRMLHKNREIETEISLSINIHKTQQKMQQLQHRTSIQNSRLTNGSQELLVMNRKALKILKNQAQQGSHQAKIFNGLLTSITQIYSNFSKDIQKVAQQFHQEISNQNEQNDQLVVAFQYISNYLLKMAHNHTSFSKNFNNEVVEPYQFVVNNYNQTNNSIIDQTVKQTKQLEQKISNIQRDQDNYYNISKLIEKTDDNIDRISSKIQKDQQGQEEFQKLMNFQIEQKLKKEHFENCYNYSIDKYNKSWLDYSASFQQNLVQFDLNFESHNSFSKQSVQKVIKKFQSLQCPQDTDLEQKLSKMDEECQKNKSNSHIPIKQKLHAGLKEKFPIEQDLAQMYLETFVTFQNHKKITQSKKEKYLQVDNHDGFVVIDSMQKQDQRQINQLIFDLFYSKIEVNLANAQQFDQTEKYLKLFNSVLHVQYFIDLIKNEFRNRKVLGLNELEFSLCKDVFIYILKFMECNLDDSQAKLLLDIIKICCSVYKKTDKRETLYISNYLVNQEIWRNFHVWNMIYEYRFQKAQEEIDGGKNKAIKEEKSSNKGFKKFFMNKVNNIKNNIKTNILQQTNKETNDEQKLINQILQELNFYLIQLSLNIELSSSIIIKLCQKNNQLQTKQQIDQSILHKLLENQSNKRISDLRNQRKNSYQKNQELSSQKLFQKVSQYLSVSENLRFRLVCKKSERKMLKYSLYFGDYQWIKTNRLWIWKSLLKVERDQKILHVLNNVEKVASRNNDEIIQLDVVRSYQIHVDKLSNQSLFRMLKTYAHLRPDINYCQGMNYLMGFIYLQCLDEELTLYIFSKLVEKYFENVFVSSLERLKVLFFQFEKCLDLFLPDIAEHFKIERIECSYFLASWFITLFSSVYQNTSSSYLLLNSWDIFIAEGWKGLFKVIICILENNQTNLLNMHFDEILNYLTEITKNEIFLISDNLLNFQVNDYKYIRDLKKNLKRIRLSNELLSNLEKEYYSSKAKVDQLMESLKNKI